MIEAVVFVVAAAMGALSSWAFVPRYRPVRITLHVTLFILLVVCGVRILGRTGLAGDSVRLRRRRRR